MAISNEEARSAVEATDKVFMDAFSQGDAAAIASLYTEDAVLLPPNMEPMTGFQLLKEVRADGKLKETPFIMVTAESKTENVVAAKKAGVNNYIVKPFNAATLKTKMSSVIGEF